MSAPKSDVQKKAELDQSVALAVDVYPAVWHGLFTGLQERGFSEQQAMDLLKTYIAAACKPST